MEPLCRLQHTGTVHVDRRCGDMARYFFHNALDGSAFGDQDGEELRDIRAAENVAINILSEMLPSKRDAFHDEKRFSVIVKDEAGRMVVSITTTMIVDPVPLPEEPPLT